MRHPFLFLAVLTTSLFAAACSASLPSQPTPSPQLQAAQAKVDKALECPPAPAQLLTCLDGSEPVLTVKGYSCPAPATLVVAVKSAPLKDAVAEAIGWAQKEVDARFQLRDWDSQCRATSSPLLSTPGQRKP